MNRKSLVTILVLVGMLASLFGATLPVFAATTTLTVPAVQANQGTNFTLPIMINTSVGTRGYGFDVTWDPAVLQLNGAGYADGGFLATAGGGATVHDTGFEVAASGSLSSVGFFLAGGAGNSASGTGTLANLYFTVLSGAASGKTAVTLKNVEVDDVNGHAIAGVAFPATTNVRIGAAPALAVKSIVFTPASGATATSAVVTLVNNGSAMQVPGDNTTVTLAMDSATPASQTFPVSGLGAGATLALPAVAYTVTVGQSTLTVSDPDYSSLTTSQIYYAAVTSTGNTNVDATMPATFINLTTSGQISFNPLSYANNGINNQNGSMNVKSNAQNWYVQVASSAGSTWHMTEWNTADAKYEPNGSNPTPFALHQPLGVEAWVGTTGFGSLSANGYLIQNEVIGDQASDGSGENISVAYEQTVQSNDPVLPAGFTYHTSLTYTAAVSF